MPVLYNISAEQFIIQEIDPERSVFSEAIEVRNADSLVNMFRYAGKCITPGFEYSSMSGRLLDLYDENVEDLIDQFGVQVIYWRSMNEVPTLKLR